MIDFIAKHFVPVATDINKSMRRKDADGDFMRTIAEQGHYAGRTKPTPTRQGLYVAMPDGQLLASINSSRANDVLGMMRDALIKLKLTTSSKVPRSFAPDPNFETPFPPGGMILRVTCRDLPRSDDPAFETWLHNFDYVWLTAEEVQSLGPPQGDRTQPGEVFDIPDRVLMRIVRYHLIDHVRGETPGWPPETVKLVKAVAKVTKRSGDTVEIVLAGRVSCLRPPDGAVNEYSGQVNDSPQGIELALSGRLTWDLKSKTFIRFDCVAYGDRWGASTYNMRHHDRARNPIGFTLHQLPVLPENLIQPKFLSPGYFQ